MPAKKKTKKKPAKIEKKDETPEEEVIEVKTAKKGESKPKEETPKDEDNEKEGTAPKDDTKKAEVTSFSQLDADKDKEPSEDKAKGPESAEGVEPVSKEEKAPEEEPEASEDVSSEETKKWLSGVEQEIEGEGRAGFSFNKLLLVFLVVAVIGLIAGGFFYYRSRVASLAKG